MQRKFSGLVILVLAGMVLTGCPNPSGPEPDTTVTALAIPGVTVPVLDATPTTTLDTAQYSGVISWTPDHDPLEADSEYTATITLTAKPGWTFEGLSADSFTVEGAVRVSHGADSGVVTAVFLPTEGNDVSEYALAFRSPLDDNRYRVASWFEYIGQGHHLHWVPPIPYNYYAYYFIASRDVLDDLTGIESLGAAAGTQITGFPQFADALQQQGYDFSEVTLRFGRASLGDDAEGQDWIWDPDAAVETRYYQADQDAAVSFVLDGYAILRGALPRFSMFIDYSVLADATATGVSDPGQLENVTDEIQDAQTRQTLHGIAEAFLADLNGLSLVADFGTLDLVIAEDERYGEVIIGYYALENCVFTVVE